MRSRIPYADTPGFSPLPLLISSRVIPQRDAGRDRVVKGFVLFVFAALVIFAGIIGYIKYDDIVEPNMPVFVCCVPSVIIASILIFFGVARRWTMVRYSVPAPQPVNRGTVPTQGSPPEGPTKDTELPPGRTGARKIRRREPSQENVNQPGATSEHNDDDRESSDVERNRRNLQKVLVDLKEQYKDGLLSDDAYRSLKNKYSLELQELEMRKRRNQP